MPIRDARRPHVEADAAPCFCCEARAREQRHYRGASAVAWPHAVLPLEGD